MLKRKKENNYENLTLQNLSHTHTCSKLKQDITELKAVKF